MDVVHNFNPKFQNTFIKQIPSSSNCNITWISHLQVCKYFWLCMETRYKHQWFTYRQTEKKFVNSPFLFSNIFSNTCILNCATSSCTCILKFLSFITRFIWIVNSKLYIYQLFNSSTTLASTSTFHFSSEAIASLVLTSQTFSCAFKWVLSLCLKTLLILVHGASQRTFSWKNKKYVKLAWLICFYNMSNPINLDCRDPSLGHATKQRKNKLWMNQNKGCIKTHSLCERQDCYLVIAWA
jgi:hypothetical protein